MCVRVQWESGISVSNSGREWKGYGWKGRGGWNITREKGINILSTSGGNSFFGGCPSLLTLTFFLLLNFPVSRLLHKARYPGLLEFGGVFFSFFKKTKIPLYPFLLSGLFVIVNFVCRTSPNQSAKRRMGWTLRLFSSSHSLTRRHIRPFSYCAVLRPPHGFMPGPAAPNSHTTNYYHGRLSKSIRTAYFVNE